MAAWCPVGLLPSGRPGFWVWVLRSLGLLGGSVPTAQLVCRQGTSRLVCSPPGFVSPQERGTGSGDFRDGTSLRTCWHPHSAKCTCLSGDHMGPDAAASGSQGTGRSQSWAVPGQSLSLLLVSRATVGSPCDRSEPVRESGIHRLCLLGRRGQGSSQPQAGQTVPRPEPSHRARGGQAGCSRLEASPGHDAAGDREPPWLCPACWSPTLHVQYPSSWRTSRDWRLCTRIQLAPFSVFCL